MGKIQSGLGVISAVTDPKSEENETVRNRDTRILGVLLLG